MYNKDVSSLSELPVEQSKRWSTDVCCTVISGLFALTLFVLACIFFNANGLNTAYFSASTKASQCSPLLTYIARYPDTFSLFCIQNCPDGYSNSNGVCWPADSALAAKYAQNPELSALQEYSGFKMAIIWTLLFTFSLSFIWLIFSQFSPRYAPLAAVILAVVWLLLVGILLLAKEQGFFNQNRALKAITVIVVFVLAIIIAIMGFMYRNSLRLQGLFLQYSKDFLVQNGRVLIYTPLFLILTIGLFCLFIFQHCSFSSKMHSNSNFYDFSNAGLLGWLNIIQLIWGLQFLRDTFNYCISANAVDWYWTKKANSWYSPLKRLVTKNWGSLAAGSFINAFFELPTLVVELFTCHKDTCCNKIGDYCDSKCFCLDYLFNLVRTDTYTYINLSGIPYCNSARQCANICRFSNQFVGKYNPLKHYRFIVHVFIVTISSLFGYIFTYIRVANITFWHIFCIIVFSYAVGSWLLGLGIDPAESISTNFFVQFYESHEFQFMHKVSPVYRKQLEHYSNKGPRDGNC